MKFVESLSVISSVQTVGVRTQTSGCSSVAYFAFAILFLMACNWQSSASSSSSNVPSDTLVVLHINDHHSHLKADGGLDLILAGEKTRIKSGGFPAVVSKFNALESQHGSVLKLHAGAAITGDLYYTLFKGAADAALMNEVCFDAFALGNHELNEGDAGLVTFLNHLRDGDRNTPVPAANVVPKLRDLAFSTAISNPLYTSPMLF